MDRDTFSHIRLWCPRPFGTYSQNKARGAGSTGGGGPGPGSSIPASLCKAEASALGRRVQDGSGGKSESMAEEEEAEGDGEEAGSENTPPDPELSSASPTQTQALLPSTTALPPVPPSPPSSGAQVEDGRVLLDTWYVIKPGNTKEKIAFFVAHQFSGAGLPRPSAMKVKGNWATDCTKAKRRRRCSSYDPPTRSQTASSTHLDLTQDPPPAPDDPSAPLGSLGETDLLSVAEMVALVEQRTAMALQGMVSIQRSLQHQPPPATGSPQEHTLLQDAVTEPTPMVFLSESLEAQQSAQTNDPSYSPIQTDQDLEEEDEEEEEEEVEGEEGQRWQESRRVAQAIAHFESQHLENTLRPGSGHGLASASQERGQQGGGAGKSCGGISAPPPPPSAHGRGEVRIAFRVSSLDTTSQLEPAGSPRCMFMSCGGGGGQAGTRAKEKITCDLYQLVSPSSRDPSSLLLAATASTSPKPDADHHHHPERQTGGSPDSAQELSSGDKKAVARERVTGFHVEVVVTGAVDQCVFYGKDSTENVQEETVCFAMPGGGGGGGVGSSTDPSTDDPPPGQLFFLQPPSRGGALEEDGKGVGVAGSGSGMCTLDCSSSGSSTGGALGDNTRPDSPLATVVEDCTDPSLCRLYRHVSHDFLEIRFQIQRLLEPRQYMLLLPEHIMLKIFAYLPTRALAALKCTCHDFKALIETYGVRAADSRWNQDPLYRDDPCKQCKRQYERGDVSLCRWHPKPYHHDLPYGRSYWMCCRRTDKDTPGCRVGLHDNNWVQAPADGSQPTRPKREDRRGDEAR